MKRYYCRAGLGYLEVSVICPCKYTHWAVEVDYSVRIVDPQWGDGTIPLLTLALTPIMSMQLQNKQASIPLYVHTTKQNY